MVPLWHMYSINQSDLICPLSALFLAVLLSPFARSAHDDEKRTVLKKPLRPGEDEELSKPVIL